MTKIKFSGPVHVRLSSIAALNIAALSTYLNRIVGRRLEPSWDINLEIGIRFWRRQFSRAMSAENISKGRLILDSLQTDTDDVYDVDLREEMQPRGVWYLPRNRSSQATVLYFHGGGYAFYGSMSRRFGAMLAHHIGAPVFAPDYRLTPEHPHPAQSEDALAAWEYIVDTLPAERVVLIGDSAGGHMVLSLLSDLKKDGRPQPGLGIGLCPWTDIGFRGASLTENDRFDLVQGWMALRFGEWLDPQSRYGRDALSPISKDFIDCAPIYLQAGGKEVLHDMITDFATKQAGLGADIMLEVWPTMPHDFQLFDSTQEASSEALGRIVSVIRCHIDEGTRLPSGPNTVVQSGAV